MIANGSSSFLPSDSALSTIRDQRVVAFALAGRNRKSRAPTLVIEPG